MGVLKTAILYLAQVQPTKTSPRVFNYAVGTILNEDNISANHIFTELQTDPDNHLINKQQCCRKKKKLCCWLLKTEGTKKMLRQMLIMVWCPTGNGACTNNMPSAHQQLYKQH